MHLESARKAPPRDAPATIPVRSPDSLAGRYMRILPRSRNPVRASLGTRTCQGNTSPNPVSGWRAAGERASHGRRGLRTVCPPLPTALVSNQQAPGVHADCSVRVDEFVADAACTALHQGVPS